MIVLLSNDSSLWITARVLLGRLCYNIYMLTLTPRQKQIKDFIHKVISKNSVAPTEREIARRFKISPSTVHEHLSTLQNKGHLEKAHGRARAIEPIISTGPEMINIPLLGVITAGEPVETYQIPETLSVPKSLLSKNGEHFALKVNGDSMIDENINDGDIVIIRKQQTAENGDSVIALINETETTLKKIYKEKGVFRLQPANPNFKPIFTKKLIIQGKVISLIRNFSELKKKVAEEMESKEFDNLTINYIKKTDIKHRKSLGQYFTPKSIRELLLSRLPHTINNPKILDPACGTGEFLLTAKKYFRNPDLSGWDIDKELIEIAKKIAPQANIKNIDALFNRDYEKYDFVIGNPPYYELPMSENAKKDFREIINGRVNIFSLFVYQGLKWLKRGGYLAFVVPPSMNNGAYFSKLRNFIINNSNIEYIKILDDPKIFKGALQSTMLFILKKGKNNGDYIFKKNGLSIFSENTEYLERAFENKVTLYDLNYKVKTGRLIWNEKKHLLTNDPENAIPLIWAHNITDNGLNFPIVKTKKPQYVKCGNFDVGPAVVVNRITGSVKSGKLKSALIPSGMKFIAENHVNVIFPPSKQAQAKINFGKNTSKPKIKIGNIVYQLSSKERTEVVKNITGNTQISKTELEKLFPINAI